MQKLEILISGGSLNLNKKCNSFYFIINVVDHKYYKSASEAMQLCAI